MDNDTVTIILTVLLAVGGAYAALDRRLSGLAERIARIEGKIQIWQGGPAPPGQGED